MTSNEYMKIEAHNIDILQLRSYNVGAYHNITVLTCMRSYRVGLDVHLETWLLADVIGTQIGSAGSNLLN